MSRIHSSIIEPRAVRLADVLASVGPGVYTYADLATRGVPEDWTMLVMRPAYADQIWRRLRTVGLTGYNTPSRRGSVATVTVEAIAQTRVQILRLDLPDEPHVILRHRTLTQPTRASIDAAVIQVHGAHDVAPDDVVRSLATRLRRLADAIDAAVIDQAI